MTVVRGVSADCKSGDSLDATPAANACNCLAPVASRFLSISRMHWKTMSAALGTSALPNTGELDCEFDCEFDCDCAFFMCDVNTGMLGLFASRTVDFTLTNTLPFAGVILTAFVSKLRRICCDNRQSCIRATSDRLNKRGRVASSRR